MFIVAELSANHNKDLNLAKESLYAIKECGADAVKLQTYTPESLTLNCKSNIFKIKSNTIWDNKYLYDLYKEVYMPLEWNIELFELAKKINLVCFSSVFDKEGVDLLEKLNNPIYKIASFEITDIPLIQYIAKKQKPIILSSGVAIGDEISEAIEAIRQEGNNDITILKCTSLYPAPINTLNLSNMLIYKKKYGVKYGISDHSIGVNAAIIAVSLKASMIEKHFILDKKYGGLDYKFSMDKVEFARLVQTIKDTKAAIGNDNYKIDSSNIKENNNVFPKGREFARSLFVSKDIKKDEKLSLENIKSIRPNNGLPPKYLNEIIGKIATKDLKFGEPLTWDSFK
ncbi:MAG: pseudaminic acid synthase [Helicobacteraceae bacterium]|nr:pseudaminic acid synthase [Helicobacteraceae bacterium]